MQRRDFGSRPMPAPGRFGMLRVDKDVAKDVAVVKKKIPANSNKKHDFKANDHVVYPTHGVGRIAGVEEQEVAGAKLELFVINFEKDKMTLRVPTAKAKAVGMRKLSSPDVVATALNTLRGRARIKRTMWSRRAQEYEAKINSGDLVSIAEVVRDLHRATGQPEQSYSERQLYEAALARMAREVAAVERIDEQAAVKRVETVLLKKAA
jgi:CarD family transcriptional regulator